MLDEYLDWDTHTSHFASKISSGSYILNSTKNFLPINIQKNIFTFMHKLFLGKQPESFTDFLRKPANFDSNTNRRKFCYTVDKLKNDMVGRFPTAVLPRTWNSLETDNKDITSHSSFKKFIYESFTEAYTDVVKCRNKICPDCYPQG